MMSDTKEKKPAGTKSALGRGLDAILPSATAAAASRVDSEYQRVPIERVHANKLQPRKHFDEEKLAELSESIKLQGIIQPIVVRRSGDGFEIVAGERRWRAAQRASLREVPVVIKDVTPSHAFELALVENLQRTDLDPIETAEAYQRLIDEHDYTQETLAERVGKSRTAIANTLRLLGLPTEIRLRVVQGQLSEGHARAILTAKDPVLMERLAKESVEKSWSVRETEAAARKSPAPSVGSGAPTRPPSAGTAVEVEPGASGTEPGTPPSANVRDLEKRLAAALGMSVVVRANLASGSGVVEVAYESHVQLDRLIEKILGH